MRYTVNHPYAAARDGRTFGPWQDGDTVELDAADAEWVNRDSPGTLVASAGEADPERAKAQPPAKDKAHRGGSNRGLK